MEQSKILILMQADIFSTGLQVQFYEWGFTTVEIVKTYEVALQNVRQQVPSLVLMDIFPNTEKNSDYDELLKILCQIPIIFLSKTPADRSGIVASTHENLQYTWLSHPCTETDLKESIQDIFAINLPAA